MNKYITWCQFVITVVAIAVVMQSCMTSKKAIDYLEKKGELPGVCVEKYPVRDSIIIRDSVTLDTLYVGADPTFDTLTVISRDTVFRQVTKTLPAQIITKTVTQIKEVYRENTARVVALQAEGIKLRNQAAVKDERINQLTTELHKWKGKAQRRWWFLWAVLIALAAWKMRKPLMGLIKF